MLPPQIPNRYDSEEARLKRLDDQEESQRRRSALILVVGILLLVAYLPLRIVGRDGAMLILTPIGLGMILVAGIQLLIERAAS
jgi:uncharacterized membrane protein YgdD (TMEM256/DUF423 family)